MLQPLQQRQMQRSVCFRVFCAVRTFVYDVQCMRCLAFHLKSHLRTHLRCICRYDARRDAVVGWSRPTYGPLQLTLPAVERPLPRIRGAVASPLSPQQQQQQQQLHACFAAALVAGRVLPRLKKFGPSLSVTPEGMLVGHHSGTFAVRAFVAELTKREVASR